MKKNTTKNGVANGASYPGIRLHFAHPTAAKVCAAGTFNDWRPEAIPMVPLGEGRWAKELTLPPGWWRTESGCRTRWPRRQRPTCLEE